MTGINFVTTILKMRAPGMSSMRMPVFYWMALASNLLIVAAFPVLTATLGMLLLDRYLGFHFFSVDAGGNLVPRLGMPSASQTRTFSGLTRLKRFPRPGDKNPARQWAIFDRPGRRAR